jgi:hypothetical protein
MSREAVRIKVREIPAAETRPLIVGLALRVPVMARLLVLGGLRLPQGRLRREFGEWAFRETVLGSLSRRDYDVIRTFVTDDFQVFPAPQLAALLPGQHDDARPVLRGPEEAVRFLEGWFDSWGEFTFTPKEGVDLGDGRVLVLNHLNAQGATSGIRLQNQEEAQLWESKGGLVNRVRQWWSWQEALEAVGLPE